MSSELIGATLGPYEIVEFLGMHGMAEVYQGRRVESDRPVLIRMAGRGLPPDPVWSARFRREAKAIATLRHANIAPAYDFGEALDGHYMVTDYPTEATLADVLAEVRAGTRVLLQDDIAFIIRQIAAGLDHAHSRGVVHRDVSPARIMITRSGQAILGDFGLAFLLSRGADERAGGAAFAAPEYLAPEVMADFRSASPASDTYSLGVVLYEILTGDLPFRPADGDNAAMQSIAGTTPDPRFRNGGIAPSVADVVVNALAEMPRDRFKNTMQLAESLEMAYRYPNGVPRHKPKIAPAEEPTMTSQPTVALGKRPTSERIISRRGASLQDERREKARLRAELKAIQSEEIKKKRAEQALVRRQKAAVFFQKWGPTLTVLGIFILVVTGLLIALRAAGLITISVAEIESPAGLSIGSTAVPTPTLIPTFEKEPSPTLTPILSPTPLQSGEATPIPAVEFTPLEPGSMVFRPIDGGAMQFVPAGQFMMGTDDLTRAASVRPRHPVMLSDYWIDRTEVSNTQYSLCVDAGVCSAPSNKRYYEDPIYAEYPVVFVNYPDAASYCLWLAKQTGQVIGLPTEAQWEKAAAWDPTTGVSRTYPWGNTPPEPRLMRYQAGNVDRPASPVGSHPYGASAYGALDMAGNVWEWVSDWWDPDYYSRTGIAIDPSGPLTGSRRVTRGGSWRDNTVLTMSNVRNPADPDVSGDSVGFRCAMTAGRPPADSQMVLTPLEVVQSLGDIMNAAISDPANDKTEIESWLDQLSNLRQDLQQGSQERVLVTVTALKSQLSNMWADNRITPGVGWRANGGLTWIEAQFAPAEGIIIPTPTGSPAPTTVFVTPAGLSSDEISP